MDSGTPASPTPTPGDLSGWQRVSRLLGYGFQHVEPGQEVPPMPDELREWASDTMTALMAGLVIGGGKKYLEERGAGPPQPPANAPTKLHIARAIAEENTQRLQRLANASVRGGLHFGGLAAVFYAVQMLSGVYRGRRDFLDSAHGGLAAGAVFGVSLHRSVKATSHPMRAVVLGAALGASLGLPFGLLQDQLVSMLPEEHQAARVRRRLHTESVIAGTAPTSTLPPRAPERNYDVTSAVIQQLEASLSRSPGRQAQLEAQQQQQQQQQQEAEQQQQQAGQGRQRRWWGW
ncbi:hypothetical protein D9Q98_010194 [Chlorella vulgaris]|uniref:Complex I assembly factor TIMMDC1, mitochondrial n=1 Tax=Chlorella vulgaris TaxID=3077 RepID=A0A9D4TN35_CHLVU|nr:hypothetical protein D9Q98_010194 [Chlorella vulgaris]